MDFWFDRLNIQNGGYHGLVDHNIYSVAKIIVEARRNNSVARYNTDIAKELALSCAHVELIQYILASVRYPITKELDHHPNDPFTYGTSPRGLFVDCEVMAEKFLLEFERYIACECKPFCEGAEFCDCECHIAEEDEKPKKVQEP